VYVRIETEDNFRDGKRNDNPLSSKPQCRNDDVWGASETAPGEWDWLNAAWIAVQCSTRSQVDRLLQDCDRCNDSEGFFSWRIVWDRTPFSALQLERIQTRGAAVDAHPTIPTMTFAEFNASIIPQNSVLLESYVASLKASYAAERDAAIQRVNAATTDTEREWHQLQVTLMDDLVNEVEARRKRFANRIAKEEPAVPRRQRVE